MISTWLRKVFAVVAFGMALAGCVSQSSIKDGAPIPKNHGLLAMHISSNADAVLGYLDYASSTSFGTRWAEYMVGGKGAVNIDKGDSYWVIPAEQGEYMWSKFSMYPLSASLHSSNKFVVRANEITYVGHIKIAVDSQWVNISVDEREDDMRRHLEEKHPKNYKNMPFAKSIVQMRVQ